MAIRLLIVFLVLAFGALTLDAFVEEGVTLPGVVSLLVLLLLGIRGARLAAPASPQVSRATLFSP